MVRLWATGACLWGDAVCLCALVALQLSPESGPKLSALMQQHLLSAGTQSLKVRQAGDPVQAVQMSRWHFWPLACGLPRAIWWSRYRSTTSDMSLHLLSRRRMIVTACFSATPT